MRTIITSLAVAACTVAVAQYNAGSSPQQDTAQHVQSIYEECLLTAGTSSWKALGLDDEQVLRVSELQTRYKQSAKTAEAQAVLDEKAAAKGQGKTVSTETKGTDKAPAAGRVDQNSADQQKNVEDRNAEQSKEELTDQNEEPALKDRTALDPAMEVHGTHENEDYSIVAGDQVPLVEYSPIDTELRAILTPAQLALFERRCDNRTGYRP